MLSSDADSRGSACRPAVQAPATMQQQQQQQQRRAPLPAPQRRLRALSSQLRRRLVTDPHADVASASLSPLPRRRPLDWRTQGLLDAGLSLESVAEAFERDGYCIVKNVVGEDERLNVAYELAELVEREAEKIGRAGDFADAPFETRLLRLFEDRLEEAPEIFRENTHLPGFFCLFFHPAIVDIVSYLLQCDELRIYPNYGCRPKLPNKHRDEVRATQKFPVPWQLNRAVI